jgi:signal transduction histidine kinase/GAF domain-containing protein
MKFIAGLVLFVLALGICISVIMYFHFNSVMQSEISQRSRMLLAQSDAVQDYVKTVLRPEMFETLPRGRFMLKAMSSSYISREIMSRLNIKDAPAYHYRRVSRSPRNKASAPNTFELELISLFNKDRTLDTWQEKSLVNNIQYSLTARPVVFTESCMQCHGEPGDAPAELLEIYGRTGGFHYKVNEVGGVVVAGFPVDMIKNPVKEVTMRYMSLYFLGIMLFAILISLFFDQLVMKNLHNLASIFKIRFAGEQERRIIDKLERKDEIEGLIEGVDELAICLSETRNELEDYAQNLENKVEDRTRELDLKARKHHDDVRLFVKLLSDFAESINTEELISQVLGSIGDRFSADQVAYHCTIVSDKYYAWKKTKEIPLLTSKIKELLWEDDILFLDNNLYVPVKSFESHWGIICITWSESSVYDDLDSAVLVALGQQVGILIENIQAFSNVRLQNDILQSVFEGISDPLLLIDADCHIIIANKGCKNILTQDNRKEQEQELKRFLCMEESAREGPGILDRIVEKEKPISEEIETVDEKHFSLDLYPLPRHGQSNLRFVLYAREITMEKQMNEKMQQTERLSAIGKMAAGVAHEINNPLGVIQCYTDLVKDAVDDSAIHKDMDVISKHTKNVQKTVQDLLNLSRPKQMLSGKCNINSIVTNATEVFKTQGASKNIRIILKLENNLPDIKCDAVILEQILTNLWLNAFDALQKDGGDITISSRTETSQKEVALSVEDNGPGMPDHVLSKIFDPFYTTKEVGKGTGLGLSVVYGFINELGGRIEVKSDDTTLFIVFFPVDITEDVN